MFGLFEDDEDDAPAAAAPAAQSLTPDQQQAVKESILAKYQRATDPSKLAEAESRAKRTSAIGDVGELLSNYGSNELAARGVQTPKSGFWDNFRAGGKDELGQARQSQRDAVDQVLNEDRLGWQEKERARKTQEWTDADTVREREQDATTPDSKLAQSLAKKMMPKGNFDGMSAHQLKGQLPLLEKMYNAEQQRLGRIDAINMAKDARQEARDERVTLRKDEKLEDNVQKLQKQVGDDVVVAKKNIDAIDKVIADNPDDLPGVGVFAGHLPDALLPDDEGVNLRQSARTLAGTLIHMRSGTAASEKEVNRLMGELGMGDGATERQFKLGLQKLKGDTQAVIKAKEAAYEPEVVDKFRNRGGLTSTSFKEPPAKGASGSWGEATAAPSGKTAVKREYSKSRNQTKIIYSDGTEEIFDGQK